MRLFHKRIVAFLAALVVLGAGVVFAHSGEYSYSGFDDRICTGPTSVGANSVERLKQAGALSYIDNQSPGAGCKQIW